MLIRVAAAFVAAAALCVAADAPVMAADPPVVVAGPVAPNGGISRATCPAGTTLVGGGYDARHDTNGLNNVIDGLDLFAPDWQNANSWVAAMHSGQVRAVAMCAKGSGPAPRVVAGPAVKADYSKATCPAGTQVLAGGYTSAPATNGLGQYVDDVDTNSPGTDNSWLAKMAIGTAQAFALCGS
ncbi:hypothetical protein ACH4UY_37180 [Streptomyces longwoodensis]|uniref:hypothetical protein n=1 Tax=Streptomyces longwoodensis TaxID=68231 RepID=UPI00378C7923